MGFLGNTFEIPMDTGNYFSHRGEVVAICLTLTHHMLFLSVFLGSIATNVTIYILLGMDQFINVCFIIKILRTKQNPTKENIKKLIATIQILVIVESLEFLIPLTYLFCFIPAYLGPNSEILGNVKNSYWQYT